MPPLSERGMSRENFIQMTVGGLTLDPVTKTPIVILKDPDNKLNLPIWIGLLEATAMATELEGIKMARPMTHDLLKRIIGDLDATVEKIEVTDLKDNTYFALDLPLDRRPRGHDRFAAERRHLARAAHQEPDLGREESSRGLERPAADGGGEGAEPLQRLARQVGRDPREDGPRRLQVQNVTSTPRAADQHRP